MKTSSTALGHRLLLIVLKSISAPIAPNSSGITCARPRQAPGAPPGRRITGLGSTAACHRNQRAPHALPPLQRSLARHSSRLYVKSTGVRWLGPRGTQGRWLARGPGSACARAGGARRPHQDHPQQRQLRVRGRAVLRRRPGGQQPRLAHAPEVRREHGLPDAPLRGATPVSEAGLLHGRRRMEGDSSKAANQGRRSAEPPRQTYQFYEIYMSCFLLLMPSSCSCSKCRTGSATPRAAHSTLPSPYRTRAAAPR
jgi:hypothetical protein